MPKALVLGIGNVLWADEGFGVRCIEALAASRSFPGDVMLLELQMFGGNGLTPEYPIEKLLRDARASMIEDGCNEVLSIVGGGLLGDAEALGA